MIYVAIRGVTHRMAVDLYRIVFSFVDNPHIAVSSQEGHLCTDERVTDLGFVGVGVWA